MIAPFFVVSRTGAAIIRDEDALPAKVRIRMKERRRHRPLWWASNGLTVGICLGYPLALMGDGTMSNEWTQPSTIMAVGTMVFACGQMWSARQEDRRRISKLEETSAGKESVELLHQLLSELSQKLDRLIERGH
jgi:hypothetical protein